MGTIFLCGKGMGTSDAVEYRHRHNVMWFIFLFIALVIAAMAAYQHGWIE